MDIAVDPTRIATTRTKNLAFLNPNGTKMIAAKQIRQGDTALCSKAPVHTAMPRAKAL